MMQILPFVNILFAAIVIFSERRNPVVTWAWLMVIFLVPYFGFIFYLLIGIEGRKYRTFASKYRQNQEWLAEVESKNLPGLSFIHSHSNEEYIANFKEHPDTKHISDLLHLNFVSGGGYLTHNNHIDILADGETKFSHLFEDIEKAQSFIHIQYYIFRNDSTGRRLIDALAKKAAQGLEVRLLIDGMGNFLNASSLYRPLIEAGGHLGVFLPPHFIRINFRNHRKIAVMDGTVGHIGGMNIGDEYLGLSKRFGFWRDTHLRMAGAGVHHLTLRFMMDWNFSAPRNFMDLESRYFPRLPYESGSGVRLQVVCSGPDTRYPSILYGYNKMMSEANKSIYIQTPYFVPDESMFVALRMAALAGLDVRIMIPANPDHPFVYWAALSYLGDLLESGVRCYEYENGFLHNKVIMIDSKVCSVGTANMDVRSFKLNFESNAFIYDEQTTLALEEAFIRDIGFSRQLTLEKYVNRSKMTKIKESLSRLLSPLL